METVDKTTNKAAKTTKSTPVSSQFICNELVGFMKFYKLRLLDLAEEHGLTSIQLFALSALEQKGRTSGAGETMSGLAHTLHCDASNVTGIVDRLSALQLITRQENPADRRVKTLQLTEHGQEILKAINAELPAKLNCNLLTAGDRAQLHQLLAKLNPVLKAKNEK